MRRTLALVLLLVGALLLWSRQVRAPEPVPGAERVSAGASGRSASPPGLRLELGNPALEEEIRAVVRSVDATGRPPAGVAQGGRRGRARGEFLNAEGRLPRQPPGYYAETDVWPRAASGRGPERLVFGRAGEVFYSPDHYRTFVRLR
jgi:guanyl-specific ribonuclease Sa